MCDVCCDNSCAMTTKVLNQMKKMMNIGIYTQLCIALLLLVLCFSPGAVSIISLSDTNLENDFALQHCLEESLQKDIVTNERYFSVL